MPPILLKKNAGNLYYNKKENFSLWYYVHGSTIVNESVILLPNINAPAMDSKIQKKKSFKKTLFCFCIKHWLVFYLHANFLETQQNKFLEGMTSVVVRNKKQNQCSWMF